MPIVSKRLILFATIASALGAAACDNADERIERARSLTEAAIEQASGAASGDTGAEPTRMADVPLEARAFAGQMMQPATFEAESFVPASRFAVGSIICKPRDLPDHAEMDGTPSMDLPAPVEDAPAAEMAELPAPVIEKTPALRPGKQIERVRPRGLSREELKLNRRTQITSGGIKIQSDARSQMLEVMSEYGLAGQLESNRTGQIIIQIGNDGADPTQFQPERELELPQRPLKKLRDNAARPRLFTEAGATRRDLPNLALQSKIECPDNVSDAELSRNRVLATECVIRKLKESGKFEYVEKDFIFDHQFVRRPNTPRPTVAVTPNDPLWQLQWNFLDNGEGEANSPGGSGFQSFWRKYGTGARSVVVAVVDTGLDLDHPDIDGSLNVAPGWDMVSDPAMGNDGDGRDSNPDDPGDLCDPSNPFAEDSYHGTHVAGTIGASATNNMAGVAGGAWDVTVVPVRALGKCGGRLTDINDGIRWAGGLVPAFDTDGNEVWNENPADIINLSIGLFEFCPASLQDAINSVTERGVVVVSAAGNARVSTRYYAPGGCQNVVSVAASDARGQMAPYSNFGDEVDVLAPGGDMSRDDNGDGRPDGILSTRLAGSCSDPLSNAAVETCFYAYEQGTSMAAPHVSAALALIKAREPDLFGNALSSRLLAALKPREATQCSGPCDQYPNTEEIEGSDGLCARPCGGGLLDLSAINFSQ